MKKNTTLKISLIIAIGLCSVVFYSCNKKTPLSPDEYINYSVNSVTYNYTMPSDSVFADDSSETQNLFPPGEVIGRRIPNTTNDFARISYQKNGIAVGSSQKLTLFYCPQTGAFIDNIAGYLTTANPVMINITEYGTSGQFIAGNFAATLVSPPPANTIYNITCDFRVKRKI
jgi:hypothetical protein